MNFWPTKNTIFGRPFSGPFTFVILLVLTGVMSCSDMARRPDRSRNSKANYEIGSGSDLAENSKGKSENGASEKSKDSEDADEDSENADRSRDQSEDDRNSDQRRRTNSKSESRTESRSDSQTDSDSDMQSANYAIQSIVSLDPQPKTRYRAIVYLDSVDEVPLRLVIEKVKNPGKKGGEYTLEWSQVVDLDPMVKQVLQRSGPGHKSRDMMTAVSDEALAWSIENLKWNGLDLQFTLKRYPRKTHSCEVKDVSIGNAVAICR